MAPCLEAKPSCESSEERKSAGSPRFNSNHLSERSMTTTLGAINDKNNRSNRMETPHRMGRQQQQHQHQQQQQPQEQITAIHDRHNEQKNNGNNKYRRSVTATSRGYLQFSFLTITHISQWQNPHTSHQRHPTGYLLYHRSHQPHPDQQSDY